MSGDKFERRFEIVAETRRRWSREEKLAIVEETSAANINVSAVARRHGLKPSLLYRWKKQFGGPSKPALVPVTVIDPGQETAAPPQPVSTPCGSVLEVILQNGRRLKVPLGIESDELRRLVGALEN